MLLSDIPEKVGKNILKPACTETGVLRAKSPEPLRAVKRGLAELVIFRPLLRIAQDLVCLVDFLELLLRSFVSRI